MFNQLVGQDRAYDWDRHDLWVAGWGGTPAPLLPWPRKAKGWLFWRTCSNDAVAAKRVDLDIWNCGTPLDSPSHPGGGRGPGGTLSPGERAG